MIAPGMVLLVAVALGGGGEGELHPWTQQRLRGLGHEDPIVRAMFARTAGARGAEPEAIVQAVVRLLDDEDSRVRTAALRAVGALGPAAKAAVPKLRRMLRAKELHVRTRAVGLPARIGPGARPAAPDLVMILGGRPDSDKRVVRIYLEKVLDDLELPHWPLREKAAVALGEIGPACRSALSVVPALKEALDDPHPRVRRAAAFALTKIDPNEAAPVRTLIDIVKGSRKPYNDLKPYWVLRREAAQALARVGPKAAPATRILLDAMDHAAHVSLHRAISDALARIGPAARPALARVLSRPVPSPLGQVWLAYALGRIDPQHDAARRALAEARKSPGTEVPVWAAFAQVQLGFGRAEALQSLLARLGHKSLTLSETPLQALREIGRPAIPGLVKLRQTRASAAHGAFRALIYMGRPAAEALTEALREEAHPDFQRAILATLEELGKDAAAAEKVVLRLFRDPATDAKTRIAAAKVLGRLSSQSKAATTALIEGMADPDWHVRYYIARALAHPGPCARSEAIPALIRALADKDEHVRMETTHALERLRSMAEPALPALQRMQAGPDPAATKRAAEAIRKIRFAIDSAK
jgi:HEAT repeat protein